MRRLNSAGWLAIAFVPPGLATLQGLVFAILTGYDQPDVIMIPGILEIVTIAILFPAYTLANALVVLPVLQLTRRYVRWLPAYLVVGLASCLLALWLAVRHGLAYPPNLVDPDLLVSVGLGGLVLFLATSLLLRLTVDPATPDWTPATDRLPLVALIVLAGIGSTWLAIDARWNRVPAIPATADWPVHRVDKVEFSYAAPQRFAELAEALAGKPGGFHCGATHVGGIWLREIRAWEAGALDAMADAARGTGSAFASYRNAEIAEALEPLEAGAGLCAGDPEAALLTAAAAVRDYLRGVQGADPWDPPFYSPSRYISAMTSYADPDLESVPSDIYFRVWPVRGGRTDRENPNHLVLPRWLLDDEAAGHRSDGRLWVGSAMLQAINSDIGPALRREGAEGDFAAVVAAMAAIPGTSRLPWLVYTSDYINFAIRQRRQSDAWQALYVAWFALKERF